MNATATDLAEVKLNSGPMPLYFQLAQRLEDQIRAGVFPVGEAIPTEERLCETYGVSRITVRRALDELHSMGLIVRRRGVGCFVAEPATSQKAVSMVGSLHEALHYVRGLTYSRFSKASVTPPPWAAKALRLDPADHATRIEVIGTAKTGKIATTEIFLREEIGRTITQADMRAGTPIVRILETRLGQRCVRAEQFVDAASATPAVARNLGIKAGTPVLSVTRVFYLADGTPLEAVVAHYHPKNYRLHLELTEKPTR